MRHTIRISTLVILIGAMHLIDLHLTIFYATTIGFYETNPIVLSITDQWVLVAFKVLTTLGGLGLLVAFSYKRKLTATLIVWFLTILMSLLMIQWIAYIYESMQVFDWINSDSKYEALIDTDSPNYIKYDKK